VVERRQEDAGRGRMEHDKGTMVGGITTGMGAPNPEEGVHDGMTAREGVEEGGGRTVELWTYSPSVTLGPRLHTMSSRPTTRSGVRLSHSTVAKWTRASRTLPRKDWTSVSVVGSSLAD